MLVRGCTHATNSVQGQVADKKSATVQLVLLQTDSIDGVFGIEVPDGGLFSDKTYCCDEAAKADSPTACTDGPGALIDPSFLTSGFSSFSLKLDSGALCFHPIQLSFSFG